jgi:uncharacterized protein
VGGCWVGGERANLLKLLAGTAVIAGAVGGFALGPVAFALSPPTVPGFSCAAASSPIETAICADPALAARDRTMAKLFAAARVSAAGVGPSRELTTQRKWLRDRSLTCSSPQAGTACLAQQYDDRLYELALADLFTSHQAAMTELTRQTPSDAPIYEAIYRYATIAYASERTRAVAPLIAPAFEATRVHPAQDVAGEHFPAAPEPLFAGIPTAEAAAASDESFSKFLDVAYGWVMDRERARLPCGALTRRPGLLAALGERWDPTTDCENVLPPTPELDRLLALADRAPPPCRGTIVIDIGFAWQAALTARRLDLPDPSNGFFKQAGQMDPAERRFRVRSQTQAAAATAEMAHYYAAYFGIALVAARKRAAEVVSEGISAAFGCQYE